MGGSVSLGKRRRTGHRTDIGSRPEVIVGVMNEAR